MARWKIALVVAALGTAQALAQSMDGAPREGDLAAERRWMAEHPDALRALADMPREDVAKLIDTYRSLPPGEQQKLRDHAAELQGLGPEERKWALEHPDAVRQLGGLSDADRQKLLDVYRGLSPAEQAKLREHAGELQSLSPEEREWALEHADTVRQLGSLPDDQLEGMLDAYRQLPPEAQQMLRDGMAR